jgi:hypothetical protein
MAIMPQGAAERVGGVLEALALDGGEGAGQLAAGGEREVELPR